MTGEDWGGFRPELVFYKRLCFQHAAEAPVNEDLELVFDSQCHFPSFAIV